MARSKDVAGIYKFVGPITPSASAFPACRAVIATTAGTINCVDEAGTSLTALPVVAGTNPFQLTVISSATGTGNIFLGY